MCHGTLILLFSFLLVEVQCQQTYPYVSFMGEILANNSYVNISLAGSGSESVQCHTDLSTCCSGAQGSHRGDWYFPSGERLPFRGDGDIYEIRTSQKVEFHHNTNNTPIGIYRCDIETVAVHSNDNMRETVYVGL